MRRAGGRLLVLLCFSPFIVGASLDAATPTATPQACPTIPAAEQTIGGLASGQAVSSGQSVTLQFSNVAFACGSWLTEINGCSNDWRFSLILPESAIQPGAHNLAALGAHFGDLFNVASPSSGGCSNDSCKGHLEGIGVIPVTDPVATLEIYSADGQCITGKISGLKDPNFQDAPNFNGAFFAVRCPP
jgi:hypothetical protein